MTTLSAARMTVPILAELSLVHRGKVRDTYDLGHGLLLVVATDAISIFDFVLDALVPEKGSILTIMSHFWLTRLEKAGIKTHLVAAGAAIDAYLPPELRKNPDLQSRAMVVRKLAMAPVEFVARGYLTGSGLKEYLKTGTVCGHQLRPGLQDGDMLDAPIDTPTTKAEAGHDLPLDAAEVRKQFPEETATLLKVYDFIASFAKEHGIIFADTKLEFGRDADDTLSLGDEVGTGDSSRWWEYAVWLAGRSLAKRKAPPPYDKQLVRDAGIEQGINKLDAEDPNDIQKAQVWRVPPKLIDATTRTYRYISWRLTGMRRETYLRDELGITIADRPRKVAVLLGSESDIPLVRSAVNGSPVEAHILSCHRNLLNLLGFAHNGCDDADVVIAAGGKAFALPGVLDAMLHSYGKDIPVIGVALGEPDSVSRKAAKLSISELPSQPVVMDEAHDCVYEGSEGFAAALDRAFHGEFPVKKRTEKPPQFHIDLSEPA